MTSCSFYRQFSSRVAAIRCWLAAMASGWTISAGGGADHRSKGRNDDAARTHKDCPKWIAPAGLQATENRDTGSFSSCTSAAADRRWTKGCR
jgi:hypothetical protein